MDGDLIAHDRSVSTWVLVLSLAAVLLIWLMATPAWIRSNVTREADMIERTFGEQVGEEAARLSLKVGFWIYRTASGLLKRNTTTRWGKERSQVARWLLVSAALRVASAILVGAMLLPILIASVVDGIAMRARAKSAAAYINPVRFNLGVFTMKVSILLPLVFLAIPLPVHPMFFAIWWLIVALGLHTTIKHLHHRI